MGKRKVVNDETQENDRSVNDTKKVKKSQDSVLKENNNDSVERIIREVSLNYNNDSAKKSKSTEATKNIEPEDSSDEEESEDKSTNDYICRCGYHPNKADVDKCISTVAFQNHIAFPSFKLLPQVDVKSKIYFNEKKNKASCHWALLLEITGDEKSNLCGKTLFQEEVKLQFDQPKDQKATTFSWSSFKKGHTLVILYAEKKKIKNSIEAVVVKDLNKCFIFNSSIFSVIEEGAMLLENADLKKRKLEPQCFTCQSSIDKDFEYRISDSVDCKNCKMAKYCSQRCYATGLTTHTGICAQGEVLLRLACLQRYNFSDYFSFENKRMPDYKFDPKYIQIYSFPFPGIEKDQKCGLCWRNFRDCYIDKRCSLTQTECCKKWICDDEDSCDMRCRSHESCYKNHRKYSMCAYHFNEKHKGKWQNCKTCRAEQSGYDESLEEWYNFGRPKPKSQWCYVFEGDK